MVTLPYSEFDAVRASIDLTLDSSVLPDATIGMAPYLPTAIQWLTGLVPDVDLRTSDTDLLNITRALVAYTAYLLLPAIPRLIMQNLGGFASYQRQPLDVEGLRAHLIAQANAAATALNPDQQPPAVDVPRVFARSFAHRTI